jgi:hypothetical protein
MIVPHTDCATAPLRPIGWAELRPWQLHAFAEFQWRCQTAATAHGVPRPALQRTHALLCRLLPLSNHAELKPTGILAAFICTCGWHSQETHHQLDIPGNGVIKGCSSDVVTCVTTPGGKKRVTRNDPFCSVIPDLTVSILSSDLCPSPSDSTILAAHSHPEVVTSYGPNECAEPILYRSGRRHGIFRSPPAVACGTQRHDGSADTRPHV